MFIKLKASEIDDALEKLSDIYNHYYKLCGSKEGVDVLVNECVASEVSAHCDRRDWSQRYFVSLKNKKYPPGRLAYGAIIKKHNELGKAMKPKRIPSCQNIKVKCSPEQAAEIRQRLSTHERTERLLA